MLILGIDPGASGGLAWVKPEDPGGMHAEKMPATEKDLCYMLRDIGRNMNGSGICYLESVSSMPAQGVRSMFSFGQQFGLLRGCLVSLDIPFQSVLPRKWQAPFGLLRKSKDETATAKKNRHKARAQELFPHLRITHKTADAVLIAEYGRRIKAGEL